MELKRYSHSVRLQESEDGMMVYYADAVAAVEEAHQSHATERNELQALIDLQHKRTSEADAKWQAAHAKPDTLPDLGELIRWLEERAEKAETDCAEYLRERQELRTILRVEGQPSDGTTVTDFDQKPVLVEAAKLIRKDRAEFLEERNQFLCDRNEARKRAEKAEARVAELEGKQTIKGAMTGPETLQELWFLRNEICNAMGAPYDSEAIKFARALKERADKAEATANQYHENWIEAKHEFGKRIKEEVTRSEKAERERDEWKSMHVTAHAQCVELRGQRDRAEREREDLKAKLAEMGESNSLLAEVQEVMSNVAGDGGTSEGLVDCCRRIIRERDKLKSCSPDISGTHTACGRCIACLKAAIDSLSAERDETRMTTSHVATIQAADLEADYAAAKRERDDALSALDKCKERLGDLQREQGNKGRSDNGLRARVTAAVAQLRSAKDGNQAKAIRSALATLAPASDHSTLDHE